MKKELFELLEVSEQVSKKMEEVRAAVRTILKKVADATEQDYLYIFTPEDERGYQLYDIYYNTKTGAIEKYEVNAYPQETNPIGTYYITRHRIVRLRDAIAGRLSVLIQRNRNALESADALIEASAILKKSKKK